MKHPANRILLYLAACLALFVNSGPSEVAAQAVGGSGVISQTFSLSTAGSGPVLNLNGQNQCTLTIYSGASFSVTVQTASDGPTSPQAWNTASGFGNAGVITSVGVFSANVAAGGAGSTNFRFVLTSIGTPPLTGVESCSPAVTLFPPPSLMATTSNITSATTTQLYAAVSRTTYIYWLGFETSGTNSSDTIAFEYSPVAACASSTTQFVPVGLGTGATSSLFGSVYGGAVSTVNQSSAYVPAMVPFPLAPGEYVCAVTAGTTISLYGMMLYGL